MSAPAAPHARGSISEIIAHVDELTSQPGAGGDLVALLDERHAVYEGRGTGESELLRAAILARFETIGVPPDALPYIREGLETERRPALVAAAARAIRGADASAADLVPLLLASARRLRYADDVVSVEDRGARGAVPTTALMEIFRTIGSFGNAAATALPELRSLSTREITTFSPSVAAEIEAAIAAIELDGTPTPPGPQCCGKARAAPPPRSLPDLSAIDDIELEDQDGRISRFAALFHRRPAFVTFFYTRCMNPEKCSLTISKLAGMQRTLLESGLSEHVTLAAITYDPAFDRAVRLRSYGEARGLDFGPRCRLLRTTGSFDVLRDHFELGVGYGPATVNQHRLECAILDRTGRIAERIVRRQWSREEALAALGAQIGSPEAEPVR